MLTLIKILPDLIRLIILIGRLAKEYGLEKWIKETEPVLNQLSQAKSEDDFARASALLNDHINKLCNVQSKPN